MGNRVDVQGCKTVPAEWMRVVTTEASEPLCVRLVNADDISSLTGSLTGSLTVCPQKVLLKTKKPYVLNLMHVECVIGEWNKDKGEYGVRVYFASGNNQWFGGESAKEILSYFGGDTAVKKFEDRVKAGPPAV